MVSYKETGVFAAFLFILVTSVQSDFCKIDKNQRYFKTVGGYQPCGNKTCPVCPDDPSNCGEAMHVKCHSCCYAISIESFMEKLLLKENVHAAEEVIMKETFALRQDNLKEEFFQQLLIVIVLFVVLIVSISFGFGVAYYIKIKELKIKLNNAKIFPDTNDVSSTSTSVEDVPTNCQSSLLDSTEAINCV